MQWFSFADVLLTTDTRHCQSASVSSKSGCECECMCINDKHKCMHVQHGMHVVCM